MRKSIRKIVLASSLSLSQFAGFSTFAQTSSVSVPSASQAQTSVTSVTSEEESAKAFSLSVGVEHSQKVAVEAKSERESAIDIFIDPSYKINSSLTASSKVVFSKKTSGARESSVSNTSISLGIKGKKLTENFESLHSIAGVAPTNEDSIRQDRLRGAVVLTNGLRWVNPFIKINYILALTKNFHDFTRNAEGNANIEYRLSHGINLTIPITDQLSISAGGSYRLGRTYKGFQRNAFTFSSDINYAIFEQLSFNLGTSNDGNALKANGVDSNISAYDANSSVFRVGLTLTL